MPSQLPYYHHFRKPEEKVLWNSIGAIQDQGFSTFPRHRGWRKALVMEFNLAIVTQGHFPYYHCTVVSRNTNPFLPDTALTPRENQRRTQLHSPTLPSFVRYSIQKVFGLYFTRPIHIVLTQICKLHLPYQHSLPHETSQGKEFKRHPKKKNILI